jgi:hypothetical protein
VSISQASITAFNSIYRTIQFFPKNLHDIFPNLVAITIRQAALREIHQGNLKSFTKLKYLYLPDNAITSLDDDLFTFNLELEAIRFSGNKISEVHLTTFDNLNKLIYLDMRENRCIDDEKDDRNGVLQLIQSMKRDCPYSEAGDVDYEISKGWIMMIILSAVFLITVLSVSLILLWRKWREERV